MTSQKHTVLTLQTREGKKLDAFAGDAITTEIQMKGEYDGNTLDSLRSILAVIRPRVSLDVGANIGNHAIVIAEYSQRLLAFEPVPFIHELLSHNLSQNGLTHAVAVNAGLSDQASRRDIFIPNIGNLGCSSLELIDAATTHIQIATLVGDDYIAQQNIEAGIDFIKVDVEGHEPAALLGLEKTLRQHCPLLLMEYRNQNTLNLFQDGSLFNRLFPGYRIYSLSNTASKKAYPNGILAFLRRMRAKFSKRQWCLSDFDPTRRYSNIYLVPERYQPVFEQFLYLRMR